jgi:O-antigen biosynthesis alpha-1,2-mannosyltransferase
LRRELHALKIERSVFFCEANDDERLTALYRGAVALVFPSLYEGFGLPPLEAMACGTPVLTSNVCALPEVTGGAALLVDPTNPEQIANGIKRLAGDSSLRRDLREKGLRRAGEFSWQKTAGIVRNIFSALMT